jgi:hypothetical protein
MVQIEYTKKPSIVTLSAAIKKAVKAGSTFIQLTWGENQITLEKMPHGGWLGTGWLGKHSGSDLASKLNIRAAFDAGMGNPVQFLRDHLTIIK